MSDDSRLDRGTKKRLRRLKRLQRHSKKLATAGIGGGGSMSKNDDDVERDMEDRVMTRDLPTSGRPSAPPPRPAPEATWDLAWRYNRDVARLHMVDPEKLFFFWEVTDDTARRASGRAGKL